MLVSLKKTFSLYVRENIVLFVVIAILFFAGLITGILLVTSIPQDDLVSLSEYLDIFFDLFRDEQYLENSHHVFRFSITHNLAVVGILWLLGITMIGVPIVFIMVFLRGMALGFTIKFMFDYITMKGFIMTFVGILPQNIIFLPCFFISSVASISFSSLLIRNQFGRKPASLLPDFIHYTLLFAITGVGVILVSLIEAYVSPTFLKLILNYI